MQISDAFKDWFWLKHIFSSPLLEYSVGTGLYKSAPKPLAFVSFLVLQGYGLLLLFASFKPVT